MYTIILTYTKPNSTMEIKFPYVVNTTSYDEAVSIVQLEANKRVEKRGGTIVSIV